MKANYTKKEGGELTKTNEQQDAKEINNFRNMETKSA